MVEWTVDVETDWGGRSAGTLGIRRGLPRILEAFKRNRIRGLFFISTELVRDHRAELFSIRDAGHRIGSHGHFHQVYKRPDRALQDAELSLLILHKTFGKDSYPYRAPKFSFRTDDIYSRMENHVSVLKHMWFGQQVKEDSVLYVHPFDIIGGSDPPNLFCRAWYSRPKKAYETFNRLCDRYSPMDEYNGTIPEAPKSHQHSND